MIKHNTEHRSVHVTQQTRQLMRRHSRQILSRSCAEHEELRNAFAVTFRPGDRSANFVDKALRPVGAAVLVVLSYGTNSDSGRRTIPVRGLRATPMPDGCVHYGGDSTSAFDYDAALRPRPAARGKVLNPAHNPSLVELVQRMDRTCQNQVLQCGRLPRIPKLPRIMLGFPPDAPPEFEVLPALRFAAAKAIGVPVDRLGANGNVLIDRLLRDTWAQYLIPADAMGNQTGHLLVSAEFCSQARRALRIYEDFSGLLGFPTWNPARAVTPLELTNPAAAVLKAFDIDLRKPKVIDNISQDKADAMQIAMRVELGAATPFLAEDEIFDALLSPELPITAWRCALATLRGKLSAYVSECATDEDLLTAARKPAEPLFASGGCRIQVLERSGAGLNFDSGRLGRRVHACLDKGEPPVRPHASYPERQSA